VKVGETRSVYRLRAASLQQLRQLVDYCVGKLRRAVASPGSLPFKFLLTVVAYSLAHRHLLTAQRLVTRRFHSGRIRGDGERLSLLIAFDSKRQT